MRIPIITSALLTLAACQDLDWKVIARLEPQPNVTVPVVYATAGTKINTAASVVYSSSAVLAGVSSAIKQQATQSSDLIIGSAGIVHKRSAASSCASQPTGAGPVPSPDTAAAFLSLSSLSSSALNAAVPDGYVKAFENRQASSNGYSYMGFNLMQSYDTITCARKCTAMSGCQAFNIYYERDPLQNPDSNRCSLASTTQIKCVFFGGSISIADTTNVGQWRGQFQVVIAGSNGYINRNMQTPAGYTLGTFLNTASIKAPVDCNGLDTSIKQVMFTQGTPFDPALCATVCSSTQKCQFFDTYILSRNGTSLGQNCVLYNQSWNSTWASKDGYWHDGYHYTVGSSYSFSNSTDPGRCIPSKKPIASSVTSSTSTSSKTSSVKSVSSSNKPTVSSSSTTTLTNSHSSTMSSSSATSSTSQTPSQSSTSSSSTQTSTSSSPSQISTSSSPSSSSFSSTSSMSSSSLSITSSSSSSSSSRSFSVSVSSSISVSSTQTHTTTIAPAGKTDTKAPPAPTITPYIKLPISTNVDAIRPNDTHPMDFEHDNGDNSMFNFQANITAANGTTFVNAESFFSFVSNAQCGLSSITLTFTKSDAFQVAVSHWPTTFTLMTSKGAFCGVNPAGRTFYNVSSVSYDTSALSATLSVVQTDISTVVGRIITQWGTTNSTAASGAKLKKRSGFDGSSSAVWFDTNVFTSFMQQFAEGFNAAYNAILNLDTSGFNSLLNPNTQVDNRIVCPDCGLSGYLTLFGGYDWSPFHFNYLHTGFRVADATLNVNFEIDGVAGYSVDESIGLDHVDIVGISIADIFSVDVTASLGAETTFALNGGGITINNLGVEWSATQDLVFDLCWAGCTTSFSGWDQNLVPQVLTPELNMIPSDFSFRGSIGPAIGVSASVGLGALHIFSGSAEVGMQSPYIELDVSVAEVDPSNCNTNLGYTSNHGDNVALNFQTSVGVELYADLGLDIVGFKFDTDKLPIFDIGFPVNNVCVLVDSTLVNNNEYGPGFV